MVTGRRGIVGSVVVMACLLVGAAGLAHATTTVPQTSTRAADFLAAKHQWVAAQTLSGGAAQAVPLILVNGDLRRAITAGASRTAYTREIALIVSFGELPDAMLTPAQEQEFKADFASISRFFGFTRSPWAGGCLAHGSSVRQAIQAWAEEPAGSKDGVAKAPLVAAAADLTRGETADTGDRSCYPAAIADLDGLERATPAQLAASGTFPGRAFSNPGLSSTVGAEILWLNDWFGYEAGNVGNVTRLAPANEL